MRRYARILIFIVVLVVLSGLAVGFKTITIGNFERGGEDTLLGLTLGLDLQGGSHLVYQASLFSEPEEPGMSGERIPPTADQMDALKRTIERRLNSSGLGEPILQVLGEDRLLVQIPGVSDPDSAKALIGETAQLEFKHRTRNVPQPLEFEQGEIVSYSVVEVTPELFAPPEEEGEADTEGSEGKGTDEANTQESGSADDEETDSEDAAASSEEGDDEAEDTAPAVPGPPGLVVEFSDTGFAKFSETVNEMRDSLIAGQGATNIFPDRLAFSLAGAEAQEVEVTYQQAILLEDGQVVPVGGDPYVTEIIGTNKYVISLLTAFPDADDLTAEAERQFAPGGELVFKLIKGFVDEDIGLTGDDLARAYPGQHQGSGAPIVNIEFNGEGTRKFAEITTEIAGTNDQIAIFLDDAELIAPVAEQAITGGTAFISGRDFTIDRVRDIALLLESGRLPIPIELILEKDVDAILGSDSLEKSVRAGVVGLILVFLFMLLYYRMPGLIAALALLIYALMLIAIFKMLPVTLTLSGVAAAILSVGMAVDANILIFERMKEEMRAGRTLLSSINIGFNRAWSAIRDSNVSTLITSGILYWFADTLGATVVQGFAATLAIGVMLSMFSAIFVSRTLLRIVALTGIGRRLRWFVPTEGKNLPQLQLEPRV
ncbi:MAG: protein translocase subunit SecD [Dehalococcoidia bacterium]|nr:protein translocase subunit SecD [Dehalococcoidia bacterium]